MRYLKSLQTNKGETIKVAEAPEYQRPNGKEERALSLLYHSSIQSEYTSFCLNISENPLITESTGLKKALRQIQQELDLIEMKLCRKIY